MMLIKVSFIALSCMVFFTACSGGPTGGGNTGPVSANAPAPPSSPAAAQPESAPVAQTISGKEIYAMNCINCHKENGSGGRVTYQGKSYNAEDLTKDKIKKMSDEKLVGYVTNGIPDEGMPAFRDTLSAEEIKAVVAHIRALQQ
jgi:mono/diheme cytochrome c family protein